MRSDYKQPSVFSCRCLNFLHPGFDRFSQFAQAAFKEVVSSFNHDQFLRFGNGRNQRLQTRSRAELIAVSADEQLRLIASLQKFVCVDARRFGVCGYGSNRKAQTDRSVNAGICACCAQADCGTKRESGEHQGQVKLRVEPVECGTDVVEFANAMGVFSLAQSSSTEVEAQHGESERVQRFHRMEDDLIVQRSAKHRMRMANQGCMRCILSASVEQSFKASSRTFKEQRADCWIRGKHSLDYMRQVGSTKAEVRSQKAELRSPKSEVRSQKADFESKPTFGEERFEPGFTSAFLLLTSALLLLTSTFLLLTSAFGVPKR